MSATVLFVCTANLCRSPMAQAIAEQHRLTSFGSDRPFGGGDVAYASAGTAATDDLPVHPLAEAALLERGTPIGPFGSRLVRAPELERAGLVLTATRAHRAHCVRLAPRIVRRCFTLRQLHRLAVLLERDGLAPGLTQQHSGEAKHATATSDERIAELLRVIPAARGRSQPVDGSEDDLADPVLGGLDAFARCADDIADLLAPVLPLIA